MRHQKRSQRLSRTLGHRRATLRNLVIGLINYQRIKTTKVKANLAQRLAERLISLGKKGSLQSRRQALKILNSRAAVHKLFSQIAPLFQTKTSGFSRIIRYVRRRGDGAELVFLELTEKIPKVKPAKEKKERPRPELAPAEKAKEAKPAEPKAEVKPKEKLALPQEQKRVTKQIKPKKFLGGLRRLFKKERDSL